MNNIFNLDGKTAIVTGGTTGLGQAMALGLAEAGANIVIADIADSTETKEKILSLGKKVIQMKVDLMKFDTINNVVKKALDEFGKIDILINNAGIIRRTPAIDFSEKDWDEVMNLNSKIVFFLSQAVAKDMMKRNYGKIINVASLLSFSGGITVPSYSASKGAVAQITKALANEWAQFGININAIAPGYMVTNNTAQLRKDEKRVQSITDRIPVGRWGMPDDLKGAAIFLSSAASDYVNGHILLVDGGWMAR
jgi:2-dehydro-3-deoxy-D-gluconate 5-dehydrogenase